MLKAFRKLIRAKFDPETSTDYQTWRNGIFTVTGIQAGVSADQPDQVYGVIMDVRLSDDFVITITAFASGESSLRTTIGGGVVGLGSNEHIAKQAKQIVSLAQSLVNTTHSISNPDLPKNNKVYFYFLTKSGLKLSQFAIEEVDDQSHSFHKMFGRFTAIKNRSEELTKASSK